MPRDTRQTPGRTPGRSSGRRTSGRSPEARSRSGRRPATPQTRTEGEFALPESSTPARPPAASFAELSLPPAILKTLADEGVTEPFPIQAATLPDALAGRDVLGRGRTGSGKTLAFGLALLARTTGRRAEPRRPLALVLVPTRELAQQVTDALTPYAEAVRLRPATVVGGMSLTRQAAALRRGAEVLVATPGRLTDLIERGDCRLDQVAITVLDEADQMADMGFLPQVTRLLDQVAPGGQRMLFSATLDRDVDRLVRRFLSDPVAHSVDPSAGAVTTMDHHLLHVTEDDKHDTAAHIGARDGRVIMFVGKKHAADRLTRKLMARGVPAAALHGGKSQSQRTRALDAFRGGNVTVLIATNVAARGIHIDDLDLVVNIDPPADHKDYLHRGGRTARAGQTGTVVTLVLPDQRREMDRLVSAAGITPRTTRIRPGDAELSRITGARAPSGVPVTEPSKPAASPSKRAASKPKAKRRDGDAPGSPGGAPAKRHRRGRAGRARTGTTHEPARGDRTARNRTPSRNT